MELENTDPKQNGSVPDAHLKPDADHETESMLENQEKPEVISATKKLQIIWLCLNVMASVCNILL